MQRNHMAYGHYEKLVCANYTHVINRWKSFSARTINDYQNYIT